MATPVGNHGRDEQLTPLDELRAVVAATPAAPDALTAYLEKVHAVAYKITDADVDALKAAGVSEDVIFEQTVAAAIGEGLRRLDAAAKVIT
jgi:alkylhydroperoxidase family enzyme